VTESGSDTHELAEAPPLVVDLDGTLLRSDLLYESLFLLARQRPLDLLRLPFWLLRGRAHFKREIARRVMPDAASLPYRQDLLDDLRAQRAAGRRLVLATAADAAPAQAVADALGLFEAVHASDGRCNLSGERKRERLVAAYGVGGYDYAGNARADLPVWAAARRAVIAGASSRLAARVAERVPVERRFDDGSAVGAYIEAMRPLHWSKNALLLVPLLLAGTVHFAASLPAALLGFLAFGLCASSVYLLNDLFDLPYDRRHPQKKTRALASGRVSIAGAVLALLLLLCAAFGIAGLLSAGFAAVLALYYVNTLAYSLRGKEWPIVDVAMLAAGYMLRVMAGAVAISMAPPPWLLALCLLLFFSLALIKRYAEMVIMASVSRTQVHGYLVQDRDLLMVLGITGGYLAVLVLALYLNSNALHPGAPAPAPAGWAICALLLGWLSYLWLVTYRGRMNHDPVVFALRDPASLVLLLAMAGCAVLGL
jgi:4-hydroxybenzoate polyprenyltransferase